MKNIKQEMKKGNPMVGIFIPLPAPALVEMAAACGYDFVIIDNEHGTCEVNGATESSKFSYGIDFETFRHGCEGHTCTPN